MDSQLQGKSPSSPQSNIMPAFVYDGMTTPRKREKQLEPDSKGLKSDDKILKNNVNPFLVFHSPEESQMSLFRKRKRIKKMKTIQNNIWEVNDEKPIDKMVFTNSQETMPIMGMIQVTKLQWLRQQKLTYVKNKRSFIKISNCEKCGKVFKNHEALGGHLRICNKGQASKNDAN